MQCIDVVAGESSCSEYVPRTVVAGAGQRWSALLRLSIYQGR